MIKRVHKICNWITLANLDILGSKMDFTYKTAHIWAQNDIPKCKKLYLPTDLVKFTPYFGKKTQKGIE